MKDLNYEPVKVADTEGMPYSDWLKLRKNGIGGSDAAAIIGMSPYKTKRALYYDKISETIKTDDKANKNWVALKMGHLLEDLVAEIFAEKTGYKVSKLPVMFSHPFYPFMQANIDFMVELPNGEKCILECKTCGYNSKDKWKNGAVPIQYQIQGRHYAAVMNINKIFFACLYDNNINSFFIREMDRDLALEDELIFYEKEFWENNVKKLKEPELAEEPDAALAYLENYYGFAKESSEALESFSREIKNFMNLKSQKAELDRQKRELEKEMKKYSVPLIEAMGKSPSANVLIDGEQYKLSYTPSGRKSILKEQLEKLQFQYPEIYREYVTIGSSRSFSIEKVKPNEKAA